MLPSNTAITCPLEDASIRDISLEKTSWENETTVLQNAVFLNQQPLSGALPLMGRIVGSLGDKG